MRFKTCCLLAVVLTAACADGSTAQQTKPPAGPAAKPAEAVGSCTVKDRTGRTTCIDAINAGGCRGLGGEHGAPTTWQPGQACP